VRELGEHARPERIPLLPGSVHVWHADPEAFGSPVARRACLDLLDEGERARLGRLRVNADRTAYLVVHALLRSVLSVHAAGSPDTWRFVTGSAGKPAVAFPAASRDLSFNLCHARRRVGVAVASGREVGIDVEDAARAGALEELVHLFLSPSETGELHSVPPERRRERLLSWWTLKEAFVKARGTGLALDLSAVTFHGDGEPIRATFVPALHEDPARWAFARLRPAPDHPAALAMRTVPGEELVVHVREVRDLPRPV
jgi:4'-phosphopantetheinyl transferase